MAKPFYSMEEVCSKLGKSADDVKGLVRDGSLREFRDAGKVFFKAEDVDKLAGGGRSQDTGEITLEAADEEVPTLGGPSAGTRGGTSIIGLEPMDEEEKPAKKDDTVITAAGIGVFDEDELEIDADPMAKTQITTGSVGDQVTLESTGSGSGLLDLTREADDTSLGAELLDEIYPGEDEAQESARKKPAPAAPKAVEEADEGAMAEADAGELLAPLVVSTADPAEGIFGGLLGGAIVLLAVTAIVAGGSVQGALPDFGVTLSNNFLYFIIGAVVVLGLTVGIGWFLNRAMAPKRTIVER